MDEWITVRNDAHAALAQAEERSRDLKERFKDIKRKIIHLSIDLSRAEHAKDRALAAYATHSGSESLQEELSEARERVARTRQEMEDLETLMEASKSEFRLLSREIPALRKAFADAEQLFWFGLFESMRDRIRHAIGPEVERAYAAYAASFTRDLTPEAFLKRLFGDFGNPQRLPEIRRELARAYPLTGAPEEASATYALAPPDGPVREGGHSPGDEARHWAQMVRG
ncbi:MAG: hypothetical protein HQL99_11995 [Magnetococcales bacterium]|nr:hypothetical protein [Magnetococcales bacterium]